MLEKKQLWFGWVWPFAIPPVPNNHFGKSGPKIGRTCPHLQRSSEYQYLRVPVISYLSKYPRNSRGLSHFSFQYPRYSRGLSPFRFWYPRYLRRLSHFSLRYPRNSRGLGHFSFRYPMDSRRFAGTQSFQVPYGLAETQ